MNRSVITSMALAAISFGAIAKTPVYLDRTAPIEARVEDALSRMTLEEKVRLCHAQAKFSSHGSESLKYG